MKSRFYALLLLTLVSTLLLGGCSPSPKQTLTSPKKQVVCTIGMIADVVRAVAQDRLKVTTLIKEDLDPHTYVPIKGDDEILSSAGLVFYNGLGLEHNPNIKRHLQNHPNSHGFGDYINQHYPELILKIDGQLDPHIWMDVSLWEKGVQLVIEQLSKFDPQNAAFFQENGVILREKMKNTHAKILALMQEIPPENRYLITCHDAFFYFTKSYLSHLDEAKDGTWKKRFIAPEGLAPDCQLSTGDIQKVIHYIQEHQVMTLFPEFNVNLDSIHKIQDASSRYGIKVQIAPQCLYGDTMSKNSSSDGSYLDLIFQNAQVIHKYLTQKEAP